MEKNNKNHNCRKSPYKPLDRSYEGYYRNCFHTDFHIFVIFSIVTLINICRRLKFFTETLMNQEDLMNGFVIISS